MGIAGMAMLLLSPQTTLEPLGIAAAFLGAMSMALGTAVASLGDRFAGYRADRLAAADWRYRTGTDCVTGRSASASGDADSGGGLSVAVRCRGDAGIRPVVSRYQPPFPGGGVGDEPAESGDGGAIRLGFPRAKIEGLALVGLVIVLFSVLSIQRALSNKSAVAGR